MENEYENHPVKKSTIERLNPFARGIGITVDQAINNALDALSGEKLSAKRPEIILMPDDDVLFLKEILETGLAEVVISFSDGRVKHKLWVSDKLNENSSIRSNIGSGYLRDWERKGIVRAEFKVLPVDSGFKIPTKNIAKLAHDMNISYNEYIYYMDINVGNDLPDEELNSRMTPGKNFTIDVVKEYYCSDESNDSEDNSEDNSEVVSYAFYYDLKNPLACICDEKIADSARHFPLYPEKKLIELVENFLNQDVRGLKDYDADPCWYSECRDNR